MSVINDCMQVADESEKPTVDNVVPLIDEQSHVQRTKKIIMSETSWVSSELIDNHQETPEENRSAADWKRRGRIFSIKDGEREFFPTYQFDEVWQPLPVIDQILRLLGENVDGWNIAAWFHFPNGWLSHRDKRGKVVSVAPKDALDRVEDVVEAARKNQATYVA